MAGIHRRNSHTFIGTTPHTHSHVLQKYFIHYSESQTLHIFPLALPSPATQHHEEFPKYTLYSLVSVSLLTLFPQSGMSFPLLTILAHLDSIILQVPVCLPNGGFPRAPSPTPKPAPSLKKLMPPSTTPLSCLLIWSFLGAMFISTIDNIY